MVARIAGDTHWLDAAELAAETILSFEFATPVMATLARSGLGLMAVQRGDVASARAQYAALETTHGIMLQYICADRVLGLLAQTLGRLDDAAAHFEAAKTFCRKAGYRPELAWSCCDYAALQHARGRRADALTLLEEALVVSTELGMRPLMKRVGVLREQVQSMPAEAHVYPAGLTAREVEVLLLMAQGKTTREIASELVISPRTVQRHTTNLYAKVNARNRVEATAFALNELTAST